MNVYERALNALCGTLVGESGGGVNFSSPLDPREIAGVVLLLKDGRVAVLGEPSSGTAEAAPPSSQGEGIGGGEL